jgi:hypothetical protein
VKLTTQTIETLKIPQGKRGIVLWDKGLGAVPGFGVRAYATGGRCAFDLLELDGRDLRREPIEKRKELLAELLSGSRHGFDEDGAIVFREACKLGGEGIVSKRLGSTYRPGRSPYWIKVKNPHASAVKREAEEDWGSPSG